MRSLSLLDPAFIAQLSSGLIRDNMESYANGVAVNGSNGGVRWLGNAYVDEPNFLGVMARDAMEDYANGSSLDGLELGVGWELLDPSQQAYSDNENETGLKASDTMESYSNGASLNSLNGGTVSSTTPAWTAYNDATNAP